MWLRSAIVALLAIMTTAILASCEDHGAPRPAKGKTSASNSATPTLSNVLPKPIDGQGRWQKLRTHRFDPNLNEEQRRTVEQLEAIGYVSGSVRDQRGGVTVNDSARTYSGLNLFNSGHGPEAVLMDMEGHELHHWRYSLTEALPDYPVPQGSTSTDWWRRIHLFENGDLLAIFEGLAIIKIDKDSKLLWASPLAAHHDLDVMPNGDIFVLTREAHIVPSISKTSPILEDFISILNAEGVEKRRISVVKALETSAYWSLWLNSGVNPEDVFIGDIFHTNSLTVLDGRLVDELPAFKKGNILISILKLNVIAVVDPEQEKVVWAATGTFKAQHDPKLLPNGNMMLFDNRGQGNQSRVQEIYPVSGRVVWEYEGTAAKPFFSFTCGTAARLPNRNTIITSTDPGRAFEVAPNKEIVWEFYNPHRAGDANEYIASLFELIRLPQDFPTDWCAQCNAPNQFDD